MFNPEFLLFAIFIGIVGGFNFNFKDLKDSAGKWFGVWAITALIYAIITGLFFWAVKPPVVAPYLTIFWFLAVWWLISLFIAGAREEEFPVIGTIIYAIFLIIFAGGGLVGSSPMFNAAEHRDLIGEVKLADWTEDMTPVDQVHMREVSKEQAQYLADKVLGESQKMEEGIPVILGSRYRVGEMNVCNIRGEIFWVAPLDFSGFWKWVRFKTTVGYVLVSAENRNRKPVLRDDLELNYTMGAYWHKNLKRHLYTHGYQSYQLREISFELDDNFDPYYTISLTKPTIAFGGPKTVKLLVVDPTTGEIEPYELDEIPEWVDRVIPEELAEMYIERWGSYVYGYFNTWFAKRNMVVPTQYTYGSDVWFVPNQENRNFWYTGITSISSEDQALVGVIMIDTRTGQAYNYRVPGANEQAVFDAVSQELGADAQKWTPTQPIPYNIYGEFPSYAVPVIGKEKPLLQKIAIVRGSNLSVALGKDKRRALQEYKRILTSFGNVVAAGSTSEELSISGKIRRKSPPEYQDSGINLYSLLLEDVPDKLFTVDSSEHPEIRVAEKGDEVNISFIDTKEELVPVSKFDLVAVELKKSDIQEKYEAFVQKSEKTIRTPEREREIERDLRSLSKEEKQELYEMLKKKKEEKKKKKKK